MWTGYLGKWSGNKSTYALLTELSAVEGPEALQRTTARCILAERLKTNSVAATQAINSLPPGKTKDLYRAEVADWLERQGLVEDAKAWRP